ncbi:phosphopeptide-binding protein (plasmid) [Burkholderia sp. SFA1]|uniref:type VI secretion system-associated FHA domain protein TagH n=1 Tax=unclassified Caballeronia TaxID=2646786 RepID=UPI001F4602F8|nr:MULTISPECIES: type VI secretion system-associated FHA domain protein TagH [unclassified Caballeronia]MCE4545732.1 type VI secretion system-associated FHA domain protein TagH [Caballeronia sp. PC1]MCE4572146.1 type VI secretion system-associated FHA domain protein TagH [Caballeronia sp. CLC5]BBQ01082.1 phosphopeptide-binding protein [Burkholderia sp. SFA1]
MLKLTVIRHNGQPPHRPLAASFDADGGTIGRAVTNRLVLDDAERTVSRMHAQIVWREGTYRLIDRGSNPALVNGAPLDPGEEVRIDHGDEVQIGGYQLRAEVAAEDDPQNARAMPDATTYAASDDPFAGLFDACAAPSVAHASTLAPPDADVVCGGFELGLDDPASKRTIDELFDLAPGAHHSTDAPMDALVEPLTQPNTAHADDPFASLTGAQPAAPLATLSDAGPELRSAFTPPRPRATPTPTPALTPAETQTGDNALIDAFLQGLRAPGVRLDALTPALMRLIGELLHEATQGTLDLLAARAAFKREMRTDATIIAAADNNPLKFSPNVEAALAHLFGPPVRGFMPPAAALADAHADLRAHQVGMVAGMRAALDGVFERFEPKRIEARLSGHSMLDGLLPGINRRARCWDRFMETYGQLSNEATEDFHVLFGRAFVAAYEAQINELKRRGRP